MEGVVAEKSLPADSAQLTNRLLARLYVAQHRHLHGAIVDLIRLGMPRDEVASVVGTSEAEVQAILDEAAELASRAIGRPPAGSSTPNGRKCGPRRRCPGRRGGGAHPPRAPADPMS